ncbi:MAG: metalloregulator ArsR/SmtB family transcription factor [Mesorhizobium sp.]|nr:metalloregulator ArsR/SmtB family transcription factor [Mesorhizobium sp.]
MHLTFKDYKFKNMNVKEMIPASGKAAELLRSLSHPQRLLVLCALGAEEKSVAQLRQELEIEQVPMSQQLMRLRADGLVEARREGTTVHYRISRPEVLTVVEALHDAFCGTASAARPLMEINDAPAGPANKGKRTKQSDEFAGQENDIAE